MIDAHRGAFEYDWRTRLHLPLSEIGRSMSWGEAIRQTERLSIDPESHVAASLAGWAHPIPRAAMVLMDLYDLQHQVAWRQGGSKGTRPKPYPRPWRNVSGRRFGNRAGRTREQVVAILREHGHNLE